MASNNRHTLIIFFLFVLFLLSILLISKRNLEPSLLLYRSFFSQASSHIALNSPADSAQVNSPTTHQPFSPITPTESKESNISDSNIESVLFVEDKETPVAQNESFVDKNGEFPFLGANLGCDLYMGTWVKDEGFPIYKPGSCPYVDEAFDCQMNGRRDSSYLRGRWKPDGCDLPRFNATDFLEKLRGKRLMLVGDSMNRNQFESLLCLLREGVTNKSRMYEVYGHKITKGRGYYVFTFLVQQVQLPLSKSNFSNLLSTSPTTVSNGKTGI